MGSSGPSAPDPYATASAQTSANRDALQDSAEINRYDTFSPYGSTTWDRRTIEMPDSVMPDWIANWQGRKGNTAKQNWQRENPTGSNNREEWVQNVELSPSQQRQFDLQNMVGEGLGALSVDRIGSIPGGNFNLQGINELPTDFAQQGGELERATFDRAMGLMAPGFEQQERRLATQLANQGIPLGAEAYNTEMGNFRTSRNEAQMGAALDSVSRGRQEQSRLFGLNQAARQQGISDRMLERTQPMNELAALLQGSPALGMPVMPQTAQYQQSPVDISGMIQNQYNQQSQNAANRNAGITSLVGSAATLGAGALGTKSVFLCIPEGQLIDTPNGPLPIEAFKPGDMVIGFDGEPVRVMMHHAYLENPEPKRFARVVIGDAVINLCDKHRIKDIPSEALQVGDIVDGQRVESIDWYNGVERSYDLLTEDSGYQIGGVPVNSMIEEMMRMVV